MNLHPNYLARWPLGLVLTTAIAWQTWSADHVAEGHVTPRQSLTLEGAREVLRAAEAHARQSGATPAIAVVDESGTLLHFSRMDGSFPAAANVSIGKARTAALFKKPTREFEEIINRGRFTLTTLPDFTPLQGGVPIYHAGQVIGAVGVSGAQSAAQDEEVALAGAAVLTSAKPAATAQ